MRHYNLLGRLETEVSNRLTSRHTYERIRIKPTDLGYEINRRHRVQWNKPLLPLLHRLLKTDMILTTVETNTMIHKMKIMTMTSSPVRVDEIRHTASFTNHENEWHGLGTVGMGNRTDGDNQNN